MAQKMLDDWLDKYNAIEKESDACWMRSRTFEDEGDAEAAAGAYRHMKELENQQEGMLQALQIFGYTIEAEAGEYKVVELKTAK